MSTSLATENTKKRDFKKWLKDALPLILCFAIPLVVMMLVIIVRGIFPFGDRSFLRTDLYHQYAPFFQELKNKLSNGESLLYSWDIGGGTNFLALFAYYLSSPLNWFLVLCPQKYIIEFITYMIILKISLCGLSFGYYLKKHTATNQIGIAFFASFYALSGYMAAYSWNIMWLDCLFLFPLIILNLERLVYEEKGLWYCITLSLCVISNYYISIMVCLTLIIYFLALLFIAPTRREEIERKDDHTLIKRTIYMNYPKKIFLFAFYSFLAAGISLVLLYPEMKALQLTASADSTFPKTFSSYFTMLEMLARHLVNVKVHIGLEHWPNIYCGVAILIFIPLYIMNRKVSYREKAANFILLLFFLASFSMNFLNFIWHGLHYPNSLPCRQSFAYNFILLTMGYKGFMNLKDRSLKEITKSIWIAIGLVLLFEQITKDNDLFHFSVFYVSALFIAVYGLLIYLFKKNDNYKKVLAILGVFVVTLEGFSNTTVTSVTTVSRSGYVSMDNDFKVLVEYAKNTANAEASQEFGSLNTAYDGTVFTNLFRFERMAMRTKNDGSWFQYPSISVFSSMANANTTAVYKKLGLEGSTNAYCSNGATALINMLFNVRYETYDRDFENNEITKLVASSGSQRLYQYNNTLSIAFMLPASMEEDWVLTGSPITNQNTFITDVAGIDDVLLEVVPVTSSSDKTISFTALKSGYYHFYLTTGSIDAVTVKVGKTTRKHTACKRRYIVDCGYVAEGEVVTITTEESNTLTGNVYYMNANALSAACKELKPGCLAVTEYDSDTIKGMITATSDKTLMFTSIPYEPGWTLKVDGVETKTIMVKDAFLGAILTPGTHTIELSYMPDGFMLGIYGSLVSILLLILVTLLRYLLKRRFGYRFNVFVEEEEIDLSKLNSGSHDSSVVAVEDKLPNKAEQDPAKEEAVEAAPLDEGNKEGTEESTTEVSTESTVENTSEENKDQEKSDEKEPENPVSQAAETKEETTKETPQAPEKSQNQQGKRRKGRK